MMLMFEFLQKGLPVGGVIDPNERGLVEMFMGIFESTVLPTHRTKYVQFLWFYIACCRPNWTEAYLSLVLRITYSPSHAAPTRSTAIAYCASYTSRASNLPAKFAW